MLYPLGMVHSSPQPLFALCTPCCYGSGRWQPCLCTVKSPSSQRCAPQGCVPSAGVPGLFHSHQHSGTKYAKVSELVRLTQGMATLQKTCSCNFIIIIITLLLLCCCLQIIHTYVLLWELYPGISLGDENVKLCLSVSLLFSILSK